MVAQPVMPVEDLSRRHGSRCQGPAQGPDHTVHRARAFLFPSWLVGNGEVMMRQVLLGAAAGAAGTTALNAATYLDMVWRGRPASSVPEETVTRLAHATHLPIPGGGQTRENRVSGLGALAGIATGVAAGAAYGLSHALGLRPPVWAGALLAGAGAMISSNAGMVAMGVTDPGSWSTADWLADLLPHAAYGVVTAATYAAAER
jgi:hypothetical protein